MRRIVLAVILAVVAGMLLYRWSRPTETSDGTTRAGGGVAAGKQASADGIAGEVGSTRQRLRAAAGDASEKAVESSNVKTVTHQGADFTRGQLDNTILTDGLQMGGNPAFASRWNSYKLFGIYVSPEEEAPAQFEAVVPGFDTDGRIGDNVTFEVRTRSVDGDWTVWRELSSEELGRPLLLDRPAAAWQYRVYFYANDPASSAKVRSVTLNMGPAQALAQWASGKDFPSGNNTSSQ